MVYGVWFMVYGAWCMIHGVYMVCLEIRIKVPPQTHWYYCIGTMFAGVMGLWCFVYGVVGYGVCCVVGVQYVAYMMSVWCAFFDGCMVCGVCDCVWCEVCDGCMVWGVCDGCVGCGVWCL